MNRIVVKNIIILSLIAGLILGIFAPIPYVGLVMLFGLMLFVSPVVMVYMIMDGKLELTTTKDSIFTGLIAGFCANFSFCVIYSVLAAILALFKYSSNYFLTVMIVNSPVWLLVTFIIFMSVLCACVNAFSAFATFYVINLIRDIYESKHPEYYGDKNDLR